MTFSSRAFVKRPHLHRERSRISFVHFDNNGALILLHIDMINVKQRKRKYRYYLRSYQKISSFALSKNVICTFFDSSNNITYGISER